MKITALTYLFNRYSLESVFQLFHHYGLDGVEIWGGRPHAFVKDLDDKAIDDINQWSEKYKLPVSMYVPEILAYPYHPCSRLLAERKDALKYLRCALAAAKKMNTSLMQMTIPHPGYGRDKAEIWDQLMEFFSELVEEAEKQEVKIVIESLSPSEGGNLIANADDLGQVLTTIDSPYLTAMIDVVPPFIAQEPYSEYFEKLKGKIEYIHLCNTDGQTEWHMSLDNPEGQIPLTAFMHILKRYQYDGWVSLELLSPYFGNPELYFAESLRILRKSLQDS